MIDIHCHILPGIDDGPDTFDESLKMAKLAADDGVNVIVATPHVNEKLYDVKEITDKVYKFNLLLNHYKIQLKVIQGADVSVIFKPEEVTDFTINDTDFILIEFPHTHLPNSAKKIIQNFLDQGLKPIITHPERNPGIMADPKLLETLLQNKVYVQITAGSITGDFGKKSKKCAQYFLQKGLVDIIASDGHSSKYRKPILSKGLKIATDIVGNKSAQQMVFKNPLKIISGSEF